jgi:hypothetical protein
MISCNEFSQKLSGYLDGVINDEETRSINAHTAACEDCRRKLHNVSTIVKSLHRLDRVTVSPSFDKNLLTKIRQETAAEKSTVSIQIPKALLAIPVKPVIATLTAAATITAVAMVSNTGMFDNENGNLTETQKQSQSSQQKSDDDLTPIEKAWLRQNAVEVAGYPDTTKYQPRNKETSPNEDVLRALKAQTQTVGDKKQDIHR